MAKEIKLPKLGQTMEEGTVVNCLIKPGSEIKRGDIIFEIETDKATLEMESPADGFVKHIIVGVGQTLLVGAPMLIIGDKDEVVDINAVSTVAESSPAAIPDVTRTVEPQPQPMESSTRVLASPRAKKLAEELGVDLAAVTGTGPAGKITEDDVKKSASQKTPAPAATAGEIKLGAALPLTKKQRITAERMVESKRTIPCFYLSLRADVTGLVALRSKLNEGGTVKIAYNDFLVRAVALALQKFPVMTGQMLGDTVKLADAINIGLAVSTPAGLVVPVIKDAHKMDIKQIAAVTKDLIEKAISEKLLLTDLEGASITISNLGAFGIESFIPVVIPGQCSILGVGRITETTVPKKGDRQLLSLTLSVDHKVVNGDYAAQFLVLVKKLLEDASAFA